jgi:hypothetical protein
MFLVISVAPLRLIGVVMALLPTGDLNQPNSGGAYAG